MNLNFTIFVQIVHFIIGYIIIKNILLKPVINELLKDDILQNDLLTKIGSQESELKKKISIKTALWQDARAQFKRNKPSLEEDKVYYVWKKSF